MMKKTRMKRIVAIGLGSLALGAAATNAADNNTPGADPWFSKYDANHDGFLTKAEMRSRPGYAKAFDEADENHDARLDPGEFVKAESIYERQKLSAYVDDGVVTAKVKAALVKEMMALNVGVETYHGQVLLSGFVDDEAQAQRAIQIASSVRGVSSVKNGMALKR